MIDEKDEWGNIELPGFGDDKLFDPNLYKKLANKENSKKAYATPEARKKQKENAQKKRQDETWVTYQLLQTLAKVSEDEWKQNHAEGIAKRATNEVWRKNVGGWNKGISRTEEDLIKMRKPRSEEGKANMRGPREKKTCPHCGFIGGGPNMGRYHFEKCKEKK
jgi:hypothetical protein